MVTTRAFINGKEVPPAEAEKLMKEMKQTLSVKDFLTASPAEAQKMMQERHARMVQAMEASKTDAAAPELPPVPPAPKPTPAPAPEAAPCCPNPDCTCGPAPKPCECKPGAVCGPKNAPAPSAEPVLVDEQKPLQEPIPAPAVVVPAPEPPAPVAKPTVDLVKGAPGTVRLIVNGKEIKPVVTRVVPAPKAAPCCPNPDCTCGPAPKPCECKPGAVCGPKNAPVVVPAPEPPAPVAKPTVDLVKGAPGTVRLIVNGKEVKPVVTRVVPATKLRPAQPGCPSCGKMVPRRPMPGDMPPCGKARPFDAPAYGTTPPCVRMHGKTMNPTVRMHGVRRTGADVKMRRPDKTATSPQAVRVIINGVETIVPVVSEGVNITIKPL